MFTGLPAMALANRGLGIKMLSKTMLGICVPEYDEYDITSICNAAEKKDVYIEIKTHVHISSIGRDFSKDLQ